MALARSHVAVVTANFWPEQTGISQTVTEFAEFLSSHGLDVRIATAMAYYPQWRIWDDYRGGLYRAETRRGVRIRRSWHLVRPRPTTLTRLFHEITLSLFALPNLARVLGRAQRAFIVSPPLSLAFTASVMAWVLRVPVTLVVKDLVPDAAVELGMMRNPIIICVSTWLARAVYNWAEEIQTLGDGMRQRIAGVVHDARKIRIVVDTVDPEELEPVPYEANEFRREFVPPGKCAVVHSGNMGKKQDLELLLRAADRLRRDERFHFYVFGDGAEKDSFLTRRDAMELRNVSHHPLQERSALRHMLSGADVVLVSQRPKVVDIVFPSKLVTALAAGAMVVLAAEPESEPSRLVRDNDLGITVPASDDAALADALAAIADGTMDPAPYRRRARAYATQRFGREAVYGPLVARLQAEVEAEQVGA
jgi:colanic acid biosynthesis glycosyl transferase WcaI